MSRYVYAGPPAMLGRFNHVATGDVLDLNAQEEAVVAGDSNFFPVPTRTRAELKVSANKTLTSADVGKKIVCKHTGAIRLTLPPEPAAGDQFEVYFGEDAGTNAVTIDPGENTIEGIEEVATATVQTAGTGYSEDDELTVAGGTKTTAAKVTVATVGETGAITGITVAEAGAYTVEPATPNSVTGGKGTGAKIALTWQPKPLALSASADSVGLYWNGATWKTF